MRLVAYITNDEELPFDVSSENLKDWYDKHGESYDGYFVFRYEYEEDLPLGLPDDLYKHIAYGMFFNDNWSMYGTISYYEVVN